MRTASLVVLVLLSPSWAWAWQCDPSAEVRAGIEASDALDDPDVDAPARGRRRVERLGKLLAQHPADYFVLRALFDAYVEDLDDMKALSAVLDEARKQGLVAAAAATLEGHRLAGEPDAAERAFQEAVARDAAAYDARVQLAERRLALKDKPKARAHLLAALDACPLRPEAYALLPRLGDRALVAARLKRWRSLLSASKDPAQWVAHRELWMLSFASAAAPAHGRLPAEIAADVRRLRQSVGDRPTLPMLATLAYAYETLGDEAGLREIRALRARLYPQGRETVQEKLEVQREAAMAALKAGKGDATAQERTRALEAARALANEAPQWVAVWSEYLGALRAVPKPSLAEVEKVTSTLRKLEVADLGDVIEAYEHFQLHLDEVPKLARTALERIDRDRRRLGRDVADDKELRDAFGGDLDEQALRVHRCVLDAHLKLARPDEARKVLKLAEQLIERPLPPEATESERETRQSLEAQVQHMRGHLALHDKRYADALAFLLCAIAVDDEETPPRPGEDDPRADAERAWKALGGTGDSYKLLARARREDGKQAGGWTTLERRMAAFDLKDLSGKRWRLRDLAGKVVVANAWASWCEPCKLELPEVQKLATRLAGRRDVVVVSFNLDHDVAPVGPFVSKHKLRFPVLLAGDSEGVVPGRSIPVSWIIDGSGMIREQLTGFMLGGGENAWVDQAMAAVERARATRKR